VSNRLERKGGSGRHKKLCASEDQDVRSIPYVFVSNALAGNVARMGGECAETDDGNYRRGGITLDHISCNIQNSWTSGHSFDKK
jgi:hypothetical protein